MLVFTPFIQRSGRRIGIYVWLSFKLSAISFKVGLPDGSEHVERNSTSGRGPSLAFSKIALPIYARLKMSLAKLCPCFPVTISGVMWGYSLLYFLCLSGDVIFGPYNPLTGKLFPKSIRTGWYLLLMLSRTMLLLLKSSCKNPTLCTWAIA